jgi:hypothetical protein
MAEKGRTEMEVRPGGVALITISNPPVNALSIHGHLSLSLSLFPLLRCSLWLDEFGSSVLGTCCNYRFYVYVLYCYS